MDTWKQRSLTYWTVQTSQLPLEGWEAIHIASICAAKWVPENRQSPSEDSFWDGRGGGITPFVMGEWGLIPTLSLALCVLETSSQQSSALSWPASLSLLSLFLGPLSPFFTLNFSFLDSWAFSREASLAFTSLASYSLTAPCLPASSHKVWGRSASTAFSSSYWGLSPCPVGNQSCWTYFLWVPMHRLFPFPFAFFQSLLISQLGYHNALKFTSLSAILFPVDI